MQPQTLEIPGKRSPAQIIISVLPGGTRAASNAELVRATAAAFESVGLRTGSAFELIRLWHGWQTN
jgi:hypothetical protein